MKHAIVKPTMWWVVGGPGLGPPQQQQPMQVPTLPLAVDAACDPFPDTTGAPATCLQGIFQGLYFGVGQGLGGLVGGLLMQADSGQLLFSAGSALIFCGWALGTAAELGLEVWRRPRARTGWSLWWASKAQYRPLGPDHGVAEGDG
jgi:hypothetical protein